jgi:glycosidase
MIHPMRSALAGVVALATAIASLSCGAATAPPERACGATIRTTRAGLAGAPLSVVGSWDDWSAPGATLLPQADGSLALTLDLAPGEYGYQVVEGGSPRLDGSNHQGTFRGDVEVSLLVVEGCSAPALRIDSASASVVTGVFLAASGGAPLDPASLRAVDGDGSRLVASAASAADGSFAFATKGLSPGKHTLSIEATDSDGNPAAPARALVWVKPLAASWADGVLYQIMIDRYRGDGGTALAAPETPGSWAGGTLDGVRAEIERGTFEELGVTALWLSPVYRSPAGSFPGSGGHAYEAYHGYWPADDRAVEPRFGGEPALRAVIAAAHARGLRVILDLVPNHVHESNPRYLEHAADGWFNNGPAHCVCGAPGCVWGDACWFAPYLPDVRFQSADAMQASLDDVRFWVDGFGVDGIRIDAVPLMPRAATRRMTGALHATAAPKGELLSIGEVFTGPGAGGLDQIRPYLGPDGLDGAFDFPLMWALRDAVATDRAGFQVVEAALANAETSLKGSGALLGRMLDNHDTSRFLSEADGTGMNDPWGAPPAQPGDPAAYARLRLGLALLMTSPGLPVIYQGDEVGLAGASDPDSRRVMPALESLSAEQESVRAVMKRLGALRRCSTALRTGARTPLVATEGSYAHLRDAGSGDVAIAVLSRSGQAVTLPGGSVPPGAYVDALSGEAVDPGGPILMKALDFRILLPAASACRGGVGATP